MLRVVTDAVPCTQVGPRGSWSQELQDYTQDLPATYANSTYYSYERGVRSVDCYSLAYPTWV